MAEFSSCDKYCMDKASDIYYLVLWQNKFANSCARSCFGRTKLFLTSGVLSMPWLLPAILIPWLKGRSVASHFLDLCRKVTSSERPSLPTHLISLPLPYPMALYSEHFSTDILASCLLALVPSIVTPWLINAMRGRDLLRLAHFWIPVPGPVPVHCRHSKIPADWMMRKNGSYSNALHLLQLGLEIRCSV